MSQPGSATGTDDESPVGADKLAGSQDAPTTGVATKSEESAVVRSILSISSVAIADRASALVARSHRMPTR